MKELKKMGTAQNRKTYLRHGAGPDLFGVSFANIKILQKRIKADHDLAMKPWETGNTDAMTLALYIADPEKLTKAQANRMVKGIRFYMLAGIIGNLIAKTPYWQEIMEKWMSNKKEYIREEVQCSFFASSLFTGD